MRHKTNMVSIHRRDGSLIGEFPGADIREALVNAVGSGADLSGADLSGASLSGASLSGANLSRADLSGADLYNANLSRANLSRASLSGADLYNANLSRANLSRANLSRADLFCANLSGANLSGANLSGADLCGADLSGSNLSGTDLSCANLPGADLSDAKADDGSVLVGARPVIQYGPVGSGLRYVVGYVTDKGLRIRAGCFFGDESAFVASVRETHGTSEHSREYRAVLDLFRAHAILFPGEVAK